MISRDRAKFAYFLIASSGGSRWGFKFDARKKVNPHWAKLPISDCVLETCTIQLSGDGEQVYWSPTRSEEKPRITMFGE